MNERYKRQLDIVNQEQATIPINIIGAGGIGSWTTLALAKMGCSMIKVYDFDKVEEHNVASQFFKEKNLEQFKVNALQENVLEQTGINIYPFNQKIEEVKLERGLIIITVDNMETRQRIAEKYKESNLYIIDGRMGGLQLEIYTIPAKKYHKTIVPIEDVDHDLCTARAISFNCMVIGGLIANFVRQYIKKTIQDGSLIYLFENNSLLKKYD